MGDNTRGGIYAWPQFGPSDLSEDVETAAVDGYRDGFAKGLAEGQQQGQAQAAAETQDLHKELTRSVAGLKHAAASLALGRENQLTRLVHALVSALLSHELRTQPQTLESLIQRCLETLGAESTECCVLVHPDDLASVEAASSLRVRVDESLACGTIQVSGVESMAEFNSQRLVDELFGDIHVTLDDDNES